MFSPIGDNVRVGAVFGENMVQEGAHETWGIVVGAHGDEERHLGEPIDHD